MQGSWVPVTTIDRHKVEQLRGVFRGDLAARGDTGFEDAITIWNGAIDCRPELNARCSGVADVQLAVRFARENGLATSVRSGGHGVGGEALVEDGLVIDLSMMRGARVHPASRTVVAQAGTTWGLLDHETASFGLATTGGQISTTGIAGLTLGGGIGWLMRHYGLTIDNLLAVDLVTADGDFLVVDEAEDPDLFWALRGGGGNFGIATSFVYSLHPVSTILAGAVMFPADKATEVLHVFQDQCDVAPDELALMAYFLPSLTTTFLPAHLQGSSVVAIAVCYTGPIDAGMDLIEPIRRFGSPLADTIRPMPYTALQSMFDEGAPFGLGAYWKSCYLERLSDDAMETIAKHATSMTSPLSQVLVTDMRGAVSRVGQDDTAFAHRDAHHVLEILAKWRIGEDDAELHKEWATRFFDDMQGFSNGGVYVNFLGDEGQDRVRAAYVPATYERLSCLKHRFDPDNFFHNNQNIPPVTST